MGAPVSHHVDGDRLWQDLMDLAKFGATPSGGVQRFALSKEEMDARATLVQWGREFGLEASVDHASNLFLQLEGRNPHLPPLLLGSHIDTQPTGGKFDGAYGVVAGLAALRAIAKFGGRPKRSIAVVAWMNEEGSRFAPGMMGSAAFTGKRRIQDICAVRDKNGTTVSDALELLLAHESNLPRRSLGFPVAGYIEAHIEQGPFLETTGRTIGVVTGIGGKRTFRVEVEGEAAHAGTTTRHERRDAFVSAVEIVSALHRAMWDDADTVRFTIGMFTLNPNAASVVPARAVFTLDLRHPKDQVVRELGDEVAGICQANQGKCEVKVTELLYDPPLEFPIAIRQQVRAAATRLGYSHAELPSPAGHDSRYLHYHCPTGMIFIPCKGGISHSEKESITQADAEAGTRVLAEVAFALANDAPLASSH